MTKNKQSDKENFLRTLALMDKDDINRLIKEKGKKPKLVKPIIRLTESNN